MPVPKRKRSRARRDKRFANKGLAVKTIMQCPQCTTAALPHQVCKACGFYKGRKVLDTKTDRAVNRAEVRKVRTAAKASQEKVYEAAE